MTKKYIKEKARQMRKEGSSIGDIAKELTVSKSSVSVWVRDIVLTEEQENALKAQKKQWGGRNEGSKKTRHLAMEKRIAYQQIGREQARKGSSLHLMGCMLYWAEGAKSRNTVNFVNSDPAMILLFIRFLRQELQVKNEDIAIHIVCHATEEVQKTHIGQYWCNLINLPYSCLKKIQSKIAGDTTRNILLNGVCGIRVHSTELTMHIFGAIQEYGGFDNPDWLF
jgi:predicted transcriptional regulator